jgi:hypothetical protein
MRSSASASFSPGLGRTLPVARGPSRSAATLSGLPRRPPSASIVRLIEHLTSRTEREGDRAARPTAFDFLETTFAEMSMPLRDGVTYSRILMIFGACPRRNPEASR